MPKENSRGFKLNDIKDRFCSENSVFENDDNDSVSSDTYKSKITDFFKYSINNFGMNLYYLSKNCDKRVKIFQKNRFCKKQKRYLGSSSMPSKNVSKLYDNNDLEYLCDKMSGLKIVEKPDRNFQNVK